MITDEQSQMFNILNSDDVYGSQRTQITSGGSGAGTVTGGSGDINSGGGNSISSNSNVMQQQQHSNRYSYRPAIYRTDGQQDFG